MKLQLSIVVLVLLSFIVSLFELIVADLNSDKQALLEFASAVPHAPRLNWNESTSVCNSWIGVTCNSNRTRVTGIHLPGIGLTGSIPENTLGKLDTLRVLSLHSNGLKGNLPSDIVSIPSLQFALLHHNNFSGNSRLCGPPLNNCSSISPFPSPSPEYQPSSPSTTQDQKDHKNNFGLATILALVIGGIAFLSLLVLVFFICCLKRKPKDSTKKSGGILKGKGSCAGKTEISKSFGSGVQEAEKNKLFFFEGSSYSFDLEDLLKASAEVLGKGSYGTAYKAVLEEGTTVVVKRLKEVVVGKKEFEQQMEIVGRIGRHPNVMPLRAYYYSKDEKLLVYNFMLGGSLFHLLHGNKGATRTPLDWDSRVKISLGAAKGIAFIHSECGPKFTHGNIKSTNVLISQELDACISDIGLPPLMNTPATMSRANGYRAPEVIDAKKITQKSDVYSFGVLLLEMLTGKTPMRHPGHEDIVDLPRWVKSVVREEWTAEVFDEELLRGQYVEEEMVQMLQIALACVAKAPDMRPRMDEAVRMIEEIKHPDSKNRPSSESESNAQTP
ncbi:hypothetical protein AAHE18_20G143100 [Arachis hypogaea]